MTYYRKSKPIGLLFDPFGDRQRQLKRKQKERSLHCLLLAIAAITLFVLLS